MNEKMNRQCSTDDTSPYFSIVIPVYNEEEYIGSCLRSIFSSHYDNERYEVIVVDNGSEDRSYEIAVNSGQAIVFQLPEGNVGAVRNYGAERARGKILVFIDADCMMDREWLKRAEKLTKDYPNCAYGGGAKLPENATWIETAWLLEKKGQPTLPKHLIGASTMLSKEFFLKFGVFDELVSSGEDTDLHDRLTARNIPVHIVHALDVTHFGNAKTSMQFIRRQIWHSENYIPNFKRSLKDPMFLITLTFIFFTFLVPLNIIFLTMPGTKITILVWGFIPALLSFKRLSRARYFTVNPKKLLKIYTLDFLYLTGRGASVLKGLFNLVR